MTTLDKPLISIIVPVYNAEKYLCDCLDSLISQSYSNIEIVCVNDGSSDSSGSILSGYASADSRVKVLNQPNGGASQARNTGLDTCTGDYVMLVDADDIIDISACEILASTAIHEQADIVVFGGHTFPTYTWANDCFANKNKVYSGNEQCIQALFTERGSKPLMCNKLYSSELLKSQHLRFNTELLIAEDHAFQFIAFPYAQTVVFIKDRLYLYRIHEESLVSSAKSDQSYLLQAHFDAVKYVFEEWESRGIVESHEKDLFSWAIHFLYNHAINAPFNIRAKFSEEFSSFMEDRFNALSKSVRKSFDSDFKKKYQAILQTKDVLKRKPVFTVLLDSYDNSCEIEKTLESICCQDEQHIEILVLPPRIHDSSYLNSVREVAVEDARFKILDSRKCDSVIRAVHGTYLFPVPSNALLQQNCIRKMHERIHKQLKLGASKGPNFDIQLMTCSDIQGLLRIKGAFSVLNQNSQFFQDKAFIIPADMYRCHLFDQSAFFLGSKVFSTRYLKVLLDHYSPDSLFELICLGTAKSQKTFLASFPGLELQDFKFKSPELAQQLSEQVFHEIECSRLAILSDNQIEHALNSYTAACAIFAITYLELIRNRESFGQAYRIFSKYVNDALALASEELGFLDKEDCIRVNEFASMDADAYHEFLTEELVLTHSNCCLRKHNALEGAKEWEKVLTKRVQKLDSKLEKIKATQSWKIGRMATAVPRRLRTTIAKESTRTNETNNYNSGVSQKIIETHTNAPLVSIVVPVYNVSAFLPQCLESLIAQTLQNIEIICVNDGSTDNSLSILEEYKAKDKRINIISKPNGGYGETMNVGFAAAKGEYVGIVESDDFAEPDMFERYYSYAKKFDLDLVKSNYFEHEAAGDTFKEVFKAYDYFDVFNPAEKQNVLMEAPIIWSALYRRSMIIDNGIRFNETPGASYQDTSFVFQVWASAQRVMLLDGAFLHYRVDNAQSSVKSSSKPFAVCSEYELSEAFLLSHEGRYETFANMLNRMRWGTYKWNYNRLSDEYHLPFAKRMQAEFIRAKSNGSLDPNCFPDSDWFMLELLIHDPEGFCTKYAKELP